MFAEVHKCVRERLSRGETAVVDATNLRQRDRLAVVDLAPADILVIYEVVDRPIEEKLAQAGRRTAELIQGHAEMFDLELANIMKGDRRPRRRRMRPSANDSGRSRLRQNRVLPEIAPRRPVNRIPDLHRPAMDLFA